MPARENGPENGSNYIPFLSADFPSAGTTRINFSLTPLHYFASFHSSVESKGLDIVCRGSCSMKTN